MYTTARPFITRQAFYDHVDAAYAMHRCGQCLFTRHSRNCWRRHNQ